MADIFHLTFGTVSADGDLSLAGVVLELEDQDVPHTILWEQRNQSWQRLQWKNRSYAVTTYPRDGHTTVYMGWDGRLKIRTAAGGSREEIVDADDGPSRLRTLHAIRVIGEYIYVVGMRRMVYRRKLDDKAWQGYDEGIRIPMSELTITALNDIDGGNDELFAVGSEEVWRWRAGHWQQIAPPAEARWHSVCVLDDAVLISGNYSAYSPGQLWLFEQEQWHQVAHEFGEQRWIRIERWRGRVFLVAEQGGLFEFVRAPQPSLRSIGPSDFRAGWLTSNADALYAIGDTTVFKFDGAAWHNVPLPPSVTTM